MKKWIIPCMLFIPILSSAVLPPAVPYINPKTVINKLDKALSDTKVVASTGIAASGTPDNTTYLRGDDSWATPAGGGTAMSSTTIPAQLFYCSNYDGAIYVPIIEQETYRSITTTKTWISDICFTGGQDGRAIYNYYTPLSGQLKIYTVNHATGVAVGSWFQEVWVSTPTISKTDTVQYLVSESTVATNNQYDVTQPHDITLTGILTKTPVSISVINRGSAANDSIQNCYMRAMIITE